MKKEFDFYIYIDYSENLVGYVIIEKTKIREIIPKISKLRHYKDVKHKREYASAIKIRFEKEQITDALLKWKIKEVRFNLSIFVDVIEFVKSNNNCEIFLSVDNNQYYSFMKLLEIVPHQENIVVIRESCLKKDSVECKLSLIIDNMLNLERRKNEYSKH